MKREDLVSNAGAPERDQDTLRDQPAGPKIPAQEPAYDFQFVDHGSIWLLQPLTSEAKEWIKDTSPPEAQFLGEAMVVEHCYVSCVVEAIFDAGLSVIGAP